MTRYSFEVRLWPAHVRDYGTAVMVKYNMSTMIDAWKECIRHI